MVVMSKRVIFIRLLNCVLKYQAGMRRFSYNNVNRYTNAYYSMNLGSVDEISAEYKYDNCLLNIHKQELDETFFIN